MATANGLTSVNQEWEGTIEGLQSQVKAAVLENSPCNVLSLGKLIKDRGYSFQWSPGKEPVLLDAKGHSIPLEVQNYVPVLPVSQVEHELDSGGRPPPDQVSSIEKEQTSGGRPPPDQKGMASSSSDKPQKSNNSRGRPLQDDDKTLHNLTHSPYDPKCKISVTTSRTLLDVVL